MVHISTVYYTGGDDSCAVNLINEGIVVDEKNSMVTILWEGVGPVEEFHCRKNFGHEEKCK